MSATVVEIKRLRPVKWSAIDKKTGSYRDGFVDAFLKYEGAQLLEEDGTPMLDAQGRHRTVTMTSFAARYGITGSVFRGWVFQERGYTQPDRATSGAGYSRTSDIDILPSADRPLDPFPRDEPRPRREQHGMCSCCPEWKEA